MIANIRVQTMLSAPRPFRSTRPETKMPTDQLVKIKLQKNAISAVLPMTYAVDGMSELAHTSSLSGDLLTDLLVVAGSAAAALALGAVTLRRRTA